MDLELSLSAPELDQVGGEKPAKEMRKEQPTGEGQAGKYGFRKKGQVKTPDVTGRSSR